VTAGGALVVTGQHALADAVCTTNPKLGRVYDYWRLQVNLDMRCSRN